MPNAVLTKMTKTLSFGRVSRFFWINFEGQRELRTVIFSDIEFGIIPHEAELQWYATGWDVEKKAIRSFALKRIVIE